MRILLLGPLPPETGGVASHVHDLALSLARRGHEVTVLARSYPGRTYQGDGNNLLCGKVRVRRLSDRYGWRAYWPVVILEEATHHDLVHAHTFRLGYLALRLRKKIPVVVTVHGYLSRELLAIEGRESKWYRMLYEHVESYVLGTADHLIAVDAGRAAWARSLSGRDVMVIPNGVRLEDFPPPAPIDSREGFVAVRHLYPNNGLEVAVRAVSRISGDCVLRIVGDGPMRPVLDALRCRLGVKNRVYMLGARPRDEAIRLASTSLGALIPSVAVEGTSVAALEAMACGTPVIASRVGGLVEILRDGETGYLVPPGDANALAERMCCLINNRNLWLKMSRAARDYVASNHDWTRLAARVEDVYLRVLASQGFGSE